MIKISDAVAQHVKKLPYIEVALQNGFLNTSAYTRYIRKDIEEIVMKPVTEGSIIMALNRLQVKIKKLALTLPTQKPEMIVRSDLFEITIANSSSFRKKEKELLKLKEEKNIFLTVTNGTFETTIVGSNRIKKQILMLLKGEEIVSKIENVASITLRYTSDIVETPGVYYLVLKQLAWEGIAFTEIVSTYSELSLIFKKSVVDEAFGVISRLFE